MKFRVLGLISIFAGGTLFIAGCPAKNSPTTPPAPTPTFTTAGTATNSPTNTPSSTVTATPTKTATATITGTATQSPTSTKTETPTASATTTATATITQTPTITQSATPTATFPMGIYVRCNFIPNPTSSPALMASTAFLTVNQVPETTDSIVITTPANSVTFVYESTVGGFASYSASPVTYISNGVYQLAVSTSIGTVTSASVTIPGGTTTFDPAGAGVTWTVAGNTDGVEVLDINTANFTYNSYLLTPDILSPFSIPGSAYPASGGVTYFVTSFVADDTGSFSGPNLAAGSAFEVGHQTPFTVVK